MNPYTPPESELDEPAVLKPQLNLPPAKPIRAFATAIFMGMLFAGSFSATHPWETLLGVVAFGLTAVWFNRVYSREY